MKQLLNSKDMQSTLGCSRSTLCRRIKSPDFPQPVKVHGLNQWPATAVKQYLAQFGGAS